MNKKTIIGIAAAMLTAASSVTFAEDNKRTSDMKNKSDQHASNSLMRVSHDRVDGLTTAKDLIGSSVYDSQGDKIGDIADLSFSRDLISGASQTKQNSWNQNATDKKSSDKRSMDKKSSDKKDDYAKNAKSTGDDKQNNWDNNREDMRDSADSALDRARSSMNRSDTIVFISVGGVFGLGDDLVQVSASELSYDAEKEQYVLSSYSKDQVANIAEADDNTFESENYYTGGRSYYPYTGVETGWNDDGTARAKRDYDSTNVDLIRDAFDSDNTIGNQAARIQVKENDNEIVLSGTVADKKIKSQAEKLAKKNTEKSVVNDIKVTDN